MFRGETCSAYGASRLQGQATMGGGDRPRFLNPISWRINLITSRYMHATCSYATAAPRRSHETGTLVVILGARTRSQRDCARGMMIIAETIYSSVMKIFTRISCEIVLSRGKKKNLSFDRNFYAQSVAKVFDSRVFPFPKSPPCHSRARENSWRRVAPDGC